MILPGVTVGVRKARVCSQWGESVVVVGCRAGRRSKGKHLRPQSIERRLPDPLEARVQPDARLDAQSGAPLVGRGGEHQPYPQLAGSPTYIQFRLFSFLEYLGKAV